MINIGKIIIDKKKPPLIIPEMGINHSGSFSQAIEIIRSAKRAGALLIKNQTHIVNDEYSMEAKKLVPKNANKNIYDLIKDCSFSIEEEYKLKNFTEKLGMEYISTPFSRAAVDRLVKLKVKLFKIGSGEFNNIPLIEYVCKQHKPLILSTGMNNLKQIDKTVSILKKYKIKFALNHCTNIYPSNYSQARLNFISKLKKIYPKTIIGLSDHSSDNLTSYASIPLGVKMIEKHFVDSKKRKGPDISSSIDEKGLRELINNSKNIFNALKNKNEILKDEKSVANFAFASVVATKDIRKGEILTKKNIWVKRPGNGDFDASKYYKLLGKKIKKNINNNTQIKKKDI